MIKSIPWTRGRTDRDKVNPNVAKYMDCAVELRDHELMAVALGNELPDFAEKMAMKLPPPRHEEPR
jgi:hypothetical protein